MPATGSVTDPMARTEPGDPVTPVRLLTSGRRGPLGRPLDAPVLSWSMPVADLSIRGFSVRLAPTIQDLAAGRADWQGSTTRPWIRYDGPAIPSRTRCYWTVSAHTDSGDSTGEPAWFETGLAERDWQAAWITGSRPEFPRESDDPCPHLRREFTIDKPGRSRLYVTALGLYRVWVNGVELTADQHYRPGWTDYRTRVYHQTFDCAAQLRPGRNVVAVQLAKGWYAGRLGLLLEPSFYGDTPALLAQLEVDGVPVVATDSRWRAGRGALVASDLLRGEIQDLRRHPAGWTQPGFDDSGWAPGMEVERQVAVHPQPHDSIVGFRVHPGSLVHEHARGPMIFDFGQNLVGWTRIASPLLPTTELIVRHGEILTPDKLVYRDNLRGAFQEDRYSVGDTEKRVVQPSFTMHGFRYAEVWGLPSGNGDLSFTLDPRTEISAVSVTGLADRVGEFRCSNELLNRFADAVEWTVRDNFLEVATDCPQRDERHGWLGDAGAISQTAAYLFDVGAFLAKFAQDAADGQGPEGRIRNYAPAVPPSSRRPGAPGWSDGYLRLVHLLVERYADLTTADRLFDSMDRYLAYVDRENPAGLRINDVGADFGDWLSLPERAGMELHTGYAYTGAYSTTPLPIVDTAHTYRSFVQLSQIADRLGREADRQRLADRAEQIRQAYLTAFVRPDGSIDAATQTAYAQAIGFGLLTGAGADLAAGHLRDRIADVGHLTTGIHGVQHVLGALADHGHADLAVELLLREDMPSWLYMVSRGATTVWEKWDGIRPDGSLATAEMNSFNHCALGAVGAFLFERLAGLDARPLTWTGRLEINALYTPRLDWVRADHHSPCGPIASGWRWEGERVIHEIEVPAGVTAVVRIPEGALADGHPLGPVTLGGGRHRLRLAGVRR